MIRFGIGCDVHKLAPNRKYFEWYELRRLTIRAVPLSRLRCVSRQTARKFGRRNLIEEVA